MLAISTLLRNSQTKGTGDHVIRHLLPSVLCSTRLRPLSPSEKLLHDRK